MNGYNVSRYARPELLATAEWLAENLGRPGFGVLDLRWRPDGSGHRLYANGHIPGATYLDWRTDLAEQEDESEALLLAGPTRIAETLARVGIGNGMVAVIYDDTAGSYAARAWWTMRVYGFDSARILVGGLEAWRNLGQPISTTAELRPPTTFTPRLAGRTRLTASDLRQLLGSFAVLKSAKADIAMPEGSPVPACGPGRVVFAAYRIMTGNTVIIEHLPGLFSIYFHMSSISVKPGVLVKQGDQVGAVGMTGFATGPHLHWEVTASGIAVDPDTLVNEPLLDKNPQFIDTGTSNSTEGR